MVHRIKIRRRKVLTAKGKTVTTSKFPVEIYGLIAEHLTGDHAFGTAAQLNCVSKAVHAETSSVVWESVYLDDYGWGRWKDRFPANLKYTKFFVLHQTGLENSLRAAMPNLVMAVETGCIILNDHFCYLKVYRPVSYTSVLAVLGVPVIHEEGRCSHSRCAPYYSGDLEYVYGKLLPDCAVTQALLGHEDEYRYSRLVDVVSGVQLYDTGVIHGKSSARHQKVFSNILLQDTTVQYRGDRSNVKVDDPGEYVTAIQLLKMSALPSPPSRFGDDAQPSRFVDKENMGIEALNSDCLFAPKIGAWHLCLTLREDEVDDFVHQMNTEARLLPSILQNRISIELEGDNLPAECPSTVLERLREVYEENITSASQLLPFPPDDRGDILECHVQDRSSVLLAVIDGNRVKFDCLDEEL